MQGPTGSPRQIERQSYNLLALNLLCERPLVRPPIKSHCQVRATISTIPKRPRATEFKKTFSRTKDTRAAFWTCDERQ